VKHWRVTFGPRGASIALPRVLHFAGDDKLHDLFRRFGSRRRSEDVAALEFAIRTGRGNVELTLGEEQLSKLRTPNVPRSTRIGAFDALHQAAMDKPICVSAPRHARLLC
jgi:hypothetical protein